MTGRMNYKPINMKERMMTRLFDHIAREHKFRLLLVLGVMLIAAGCTTDQIAPTASNTNFDSKESADLYGVPYPSLTEEMLTDGPAPGYRFLQLPAADMLDALPCDTLQNSRWCSRTSDNTFRIDHLVEVRIPRYRLPESATVTIISPMACQAVADFYPHPLQFTGDVEIKWYVKDFGLPRNFDYSTLIPWYVNDQGEFEQVAFEWQHGHDFLVVTTDHFSRYIISQCGG
jgi:hypothetical protein